MFPQIGTEMGRRLPPPGTKEANVHAYKGRLIGREINQVMSPEGKANQIKMPPGPDAPIPKSRWFNTAESAEHHLKWMKQDCHRRQGAFNEEELVAIFNDYTDRRVLRAMNLEQ